MTLVLPNNFYSMKTRDKIKESIFIEKKFIHTKSNVGSVRNGGH